MEKSIYFHIVHLPKPLDECSAEYPRYKGSHNVWYTIKHGDDGLALELKEAFAAIKPYDSALLNTACVVIGSRIYMIAGNSMSHPRAEISNDVHFIDTHRPDSGWKFHSSVPIFYGAEQAVNIDDHWVVVLGAYPNTFNRSPWVAAINFDTLELIQNDSHQAVLYPDLVTCLPPGIVYVYNFRLGGCFKLDFHNDTWDRCEGKMLDLDLFFDSVHAVDDGILYMYDCSSFRFISFDLCHNKELYVIDLPHDRNSFPCMEIVDHLLVLSKNTFCIVWNWSDCYDKVYIGYTRFSVVVSGDVHQIVLEDNKVFTVPGGYRLVNVLAVAAIGPSLGEEEHSSREQMSADGSTEEIVTSEDLDGERPSSGEEEHTSREPNNGANNGC